MDIARMLPSSTPATPQLGLELVRSGFFVLFLHEQFHHRVESMGIRYLVVEGAGRYRPYKSGVYRPALNTNDNLEEALANANAFRRLSDPPYSKCVSQVVRDATRNFLRWRFPFDPPGYDQAPKYLSKAAFEKGTSLLHAQVQEANLRPARSLTDFEVAGFDQSLFSINSRIWQVVRRGQASVLPGSSPYKSIGTREMEQLAKARGYQPKPGAGKGSHIRMERPGAPSITIPSNRKDLSPGVIKSCLAALGGYSLSDIPRLLQSL
jgi:predicted RNA binding protein YcfA (HicA-like mRNA interferase family)